MTPVAAAKATSANPTVDRCDSCRRDSRHHKRSAAITAPPGGRRKPDRGLSAPTAAARL